MRINLISPLFVFTATLASTGAHAQWVEVEYYLSTTQTHEDVYSGYTNSTQSPIGPYTGYGSMPYFQYVTEDGYATTNPNFRAGFQTLSTFTGYYVAEYENVMVPANSTFYIRVREVSKIFTLSSQIRLATNFTTMVVATASVLPSGSRVIGGVQAGSHLLQTRSGGQGMKQRGTGAQRPM